MSFSGCEEAIMTLLLVNYELYGLDMIRKSRLLKRGTIYVVLNRLEEQGWISSRLVASEDSSLPSRRMYKATGSGVKAFEEWRDSQIHNWGCLT